MKVISIKLIEKYAEFKQTENHVQFLFNFNFKQVSL